MNKSVKIFLIILAAAFFNLQADAKPVKLNNLIEDSALNKTSTIAVSIKDAKNGNVVYEYNQNKLLHPASTLKVFTAAASYDALGKDYAYKTQLYKDKNNNVYIKLSGDPFLSSADLKLLLKPLKSFKDKTIKNLYIDDSVFDNSEWGTGWMWDDDTNTLMPKYSAYNLDNNLFTISADKDSAGKSAVLSTSGTYPIAVLNNVKTGSSNNLKVSRYNWQSPDIVEITGCLNSSAVINVPINNMRRYFVYKVSSYLSEYGIKAQSIDAVPKMVPSDAVLITELSHQSASMYPAIIKNSDNRLAETLFKSAGSKYDNATGSLQNSLRMFHNFYNKNKVDTSEIVIADGSGISRNTLISADWMTNALVMLYKSDNSDFIMQNLAKPGEGTLDTRLYELRGNAWLKTGTLANISAITGYIKSHDDKKTYAVSILIQNFKCSQQDIKAFEDSVLMNLYNL